MHSTVSNGIEHLPRRDRFYFESVLEILHDLHIGIPVYSTAVHPRSVADMGGELNVGESIAEYLERMVAQTKNFFILKTKTIHLHKCL